MEGAKEGTFLAEGGFGSDRPTDQVLLALPSLPLSCLPCLLRAHSVPATVDNMTGLSLTEGELAPQLHEFSFAAITP